VAAALLPHLTELLAFAPYTQSADLGLSPELSTAG
jgi:hypothetical protein